MPYRVYFDFSRSNGESTFNRVAWVKEYEKVELIRGDIRSVKTSLAAIVGLLASSTVLRTESQVSELRVIGDTILNQQQQNQALTTQLLANQRNMEISQDRTQSLLNELLLANAASQTRTLVSEDLSTMAPSCTTGRWMFQLRSVTQKRHFKLDGSA